MSLVVCSNLESDATTVGRDQSIFKPYSFRNALSSTMTLPKNCQVALESVKYNLDGTIAIGRNSYIAYFYFGEDLDATEDMDYSTAYPIRFPLVDIPPNQVKELSFTDVVREIQSQLNKFVFHPNLRDLVTCSVKTDPTSGDLQGITINFDQYSGSTSTVPTTTKEFGNPALIGENAGWSYENGSFTTNGDSIDQDTPAVALLSDKPISLNDGELIVDFSSPNDANVEWRVGLSRYVNREDNSYDIGFWPMFMSDFGSREELEGPQPGNTKESGLMFADYLVCRVGTELKVCHTSGNSTYADTPTWLDVVMGNSAVPDNYNLSTNASSFTKVKFTCSGQRIKIEMLEADDTAHVLYDYDSTYADNEILKPINQSCWTMYPVLSIERDATVNGHTLVVEDFIGCDNISNHNIEDVNNSWYQSVQGDDEPYGDSGAVRELETRPWNDEQEAKATYNIQADINGSGAIDLSAKLITQQSDQYTPTFGANSKSLLGFPKSIMSGVYQASPTSRLRIESTDTPEMLSTRTMFVRLENFTQEASNARQGNRSKIIAHLPRETANNKRIFHQPAERVYLDLNNSEPLQVNSFDVSFCYSNEQYATNLAGQSVVVLHFKEKSS
tara:strand:- start:915 stop:2759 length:1845 start_codon:yes stop_codon:yes gene_type:complete